MTFSVIGLCGAHGTGKSTIIKVVKEAGYPVDESQLSRTAQTFLGWDSLLPAQQSEENMWALQDAILAAMYDRDKQINDAKIITLVDRTPADVWGYVELWVSRLAGNVDKERLRLYKQQCRVMAEKYLKHLIVPIRDEIAFVAEKNRADDRSRMFHETAVKEFLSSGMLPTAAIQSIHIDYRLTEVVQRMKL